MSDKHELYDERISRLYRAGSRNEPPEHLDKKIIQAARDATSKRKISSAWPSMATAAVLVLSISLVLKVLEQEPLEQSAMDSTPSELDSNFRAPVEVKESEEQAAGQDVKKDALREIITPKAIKEEKYKTSSERSELRAPAPALAPKFEDAAPVKKVIPKRQNAPALETIIKPPEAPASLTTGKSEAMEASQRQSSPASADMIEQKAKQHRRLKLQAMPRSMQQEPDAAGKIDPCSEVSIPDTESISEWQNHFQSAKLQGNHIAAKCLQREFQRRFRKPLPILEQN